MTVTSIEVHLPSFSHSFSISVPSDSTIIDLKREISRTCIGSPSTAGQRVIYKGRVLEDTEIVSQVWKTTDEPRVCLLAVHPSAWTAAPPSSGQRPINVTPPMDATSHPPPFPPVRAAFANVPPAGAGRRPSSFSYVKFMHLNALRALSGEPRIPWPERFCDLDTARALARMGIEGTGHGWPSILNEDFPVNSLEQGEGVKYVSVNIDGLHYLSLATPDAAPTAVQVHAFRVLSYTFPLLSVRPQSLPQLSNPLQVNAIPRPIAPLGGLHIRGAFHLPIRPLIVPLIFLTIRTTLLLYFFQPARKPLFGLMVLVWVAWEVIGAIRGALGADNGNANGLHNNRVDNVGNVNGPAGGEGAAAQARPGANNNATQPAAPTSQEAILNHLAQLNLSSEARFVEPDATPSPNAPPPSLTHKIKMFCALFFLTLHPAIWDRRRTALRAREGRVREEARTREARALQRERERAEREENQRRGVETESTPEISETPSSTLKPFWVAEYVQRVQSGDWVDE